MILKAKWDVKAWAICYGNHSYEGATTTPATCQRLLRNRTYNVYQLVKRDFDGYDLDLNALVALTSFYYNAGRHSHIINAIKFESESRVRYLFKDYEYGKGVWYKGLQRRRHAELNLLYP